LNKQLTVYSHTHYKIAQRMCTLKTVKVVYLQLKLINSP